MAVTSAKGLRDKLFDAAMRAKQVRDAVSKQRALREGVDTGDVRQSAEVAPSPSFVAGPLPR